MSTETPARDPESGSGAAPALPPPDSTAGRGRRNFAVGVAAGVAAAAMLVAIGIAVTGAPRPDAGLQALQARLDAVERRAAVPAAPVDLAPLTARIAALEQRPAAPAAPPPALAEAVRGIEATRSQLGQIVQRLEKAEAALAERGTPPPPPDMAPLRAEIAALAERLHAIDDAIRSMQPVVAALTAEDRRLSHELARMQDSAALERGRDARRSDRLVLAVFTLRDAVRRAGPYAVELKAVEAVAGGDPAVTAALVPLAPLAETGLPALDTLRQRFAGVARAMLTAEHAQAGAGWLDQMGARLSSVVTIRRTGEVAGDTAEAVAARAETRLATGDLAGAVRELEALTGPAAEPAAAWLAAARGRLAAEAGLAALTATALDLARAP